MFSFFYQHETKKSPLFQSNSLPLGHIACRAGRFRGLGVARLSLRRGWIFTVDQTGLEPVTSRL